MCSLKKERKRNIPCKPEEEKSSKEREGEEGLLRPANQKKMKC